MRSTEGDDPTQKASRRAPRRAPGCERALVASTSIAVLAGGVWLGGMLTLGAIAAPVVFGMLAAPSSGDVMTTVFRRFDKVALSCAGIIVVAEVVRAMVRKRVGKLDVARIASVLIATGLLVWQAMVLSPTIEALHRGGAVRGSGEGGMQLDSVHDLAENESKVQLLFVAAIIVMHVASIAWRGERRAVRAKRGLDEAVNT